MEIIAWLGVTRQELEASIGAEFDAEYAGVHSKYWGRTHITEWRSQYIAFAAPRIEQLPHMLHHPYRRWLETRVADPELVADGFTIAHLGVLASDNGNVLSGMRKPQLMSAAFVSLADVLAHPGRLRADLRRVRHLHKYRTAW